MNQVKKTTSDPTTMAELLASAAAKIPSFSSGQKVKGTVIAKNSKSLILDIGGKSEGVVAEKAFAEARDFIKALKVGDTVTASVLVPETKDGVTLLSLRQAAFDALWEKLEKVKEEGKEVVVFGKGVNPSGLTVDVEGLTGFIPGSQLGKEAAKNSQSLVGKYFKAKVIEVDKLANKVVLSEREVSDAEDLKASKEALAKIKEGDIYDGVVTTVASFGCFVKLDLGKKDVSIEGLVHISELSWGKVESVEEAVSEGDKVKVKVLGIKDGKISLSVKAAQKDPWEEIDKKYSIEAKVKGKVTRVSDFGAFVEVEPGIEGLIHITNIPPGQRLAEGQEVNCYVQDLDPKAKKLSLGLVLTTKPVGYK
ncbi:MAG: 30S ribosomal protein S1 [Patescibacteria group bacterium]